MANGELRIIMLVWSIIKFVLFVLFSIHILKYLCNNIHNRARTDKRSPVNKTHKYFALTLIAASAR